MKYAIALLAVSSVACFAQVRTATEDYVTNRVAAARAELLATNAAAIAAEALLRVAGDAAVSNRADEVRAEMLETNAAVAGALATALQPSWAVTGTVANAEGLVAPDGSLVWNEIIGGTNWQYQVTNTTDVYVSAVSGDGYNGPPLGSVWSNRVFEAAGGGYPDAYAWDYVDLYVYGLRFYFSVPASLSGVWYVPDTTQQIKWQNDGTESLPTTMSADGGIGSFSIDWVPVTNRYQIATQTGTVILISEHDGDPDAHPTLPRHSDVTNIVSAATNPLLSKAEAAATYLPTASIPGPGCTDLGTATNLVIDGTSVYYTAAPTSAYTITVSQPVSSGYTYCLTTYSDSPIALANADLRNDWVLAGTNTLVFYPGTTNRWLVKGSAP